MSITLNRPAQEANDWFTPVDNNWEMIQDALNNGRYRAVSTSDSVAAADAGGYLNVTTGGGNITITLGSAATLGAGFVVTIRKADSGAGNVLIATTSSQTINGATSNKLLSQCGYIRVLSDGSNWIVLAAYDYISQTIPFASAVTPANITPANVASIGLGPGEWEITGLGEFGLNGGTTNTARLSLSTTSGVEGTDGDSLTYAFIPTVNYNSTAIIPAWRVVQTSNFTVYLVGLANWGVAATKMWGRVSAIRVG